MNKHIVFFILAGLLASAAAMADCPHNRLDKDRCKKQNVAPPEGLGELMFMLTPPASEDKCCEQAGVRNGMVEFCRWYLQHEEQINAFQSSGNDKELMLPFNVNWQNVQQYFDFICKNYPDIIESVSGSGTVKANSPAVSPVVKPAKDHKGNVSVNEEEEADTARTAAVAIANNY